MLNYKTFQLAHDAFQKELILAKFNLERAKKSEALNFPGFIKPNEEIFKFYEDIDNGYIKEIFYNSSIEEEQDLLNEAINWLVETHKDLVRFNDFCLQAKNRGDLKEYINSKYLFNMIKLIDILLEAKKEKPGLWANIRAKRARGEKPAKKGSKAFKKAVKAAKEINKATK